MIDDVLTENGGLLHVPLCGQVGGTFLKLSYSLGLFVGPLLHALKLGVGWWVGGLPHFSVSPRPLGFGFRTKGFGARA